MKWEYKYIDVDAKMSYKKTMELLHQELNKMGRFLARLEKRQKKLLLTVLIPASLLALLMVADIVLRLIFH